MFIALFTTTQQYAFHCLCLCNSTCVFHLTCFFRKQYCFIYNHEMLFLLQLEDIAFSATTGDIIGYVDFDDETLTAMAHSSDDVATHMLAFFYEVK